MLVKIFERTWVIRLFGIALIVAPFVNTAHSVLELSGIDKTYLIFYCWQFFKSAPLPQQALQTASFVIGIIMLRGAVSAWKYALTLLGAYIILQFTQLNSNMRDNWNWIYLATNVLVFFFIADQIVLKPRPPKQVSPIVPNANAQPNAAPAVPDSVLATERETAPAMELVATSGGEVFIPKIEKVAAVPDQSIADAVKEVSEKLKAEAEAERIKREQASAEAARAAAESAKAMAEAQRAAEEAARAKAEAEKERIHREQMAAEAERASQQAQKLASEAANAKAQAEAERIDRERIISNASAEAEKLRAEMEKLKLDQAEQLKSEIERLRLEKDAELAKQVALEAEKHRAELEKIRREQIEWIQKQKSNSSSLMPQTELQASSAKKVLVDFEGFGNWATVTDVSNAGIRVRAIAPAPPEITSRVVELDLDSHLSVKLKFHQQDGANYFFKFVSLTNAEKLAINRWLINLAS